MKFGYNSAGYQMVEQQSIWKAPDTINVSNVGKTDHGYIFIQEYESGLYTNRKNTKSLPQRLIYNENFPTIK